MQIGRCWKMLSDSKTTVRVKNPSILKIILSHRMVFLTFMWLMGARSLLNYRYPERRVNFVLNTFFSDVDGATGLMTKFDWKRLLSGLGMSESGNAGSFGAGFVDHMRLYLGEDKTRRKYYSELMYQFLRNELHRELLETRKITALTVDVTQRCNIQCTHCFADSTPQKRAKLDTHQAVRFMREAIECGGCRFFAILGGEPLLEIDRIVTIANSFPYVPIVIFTNGTLVTDKTCAKLKGCKNISIFVSIEGFKDLTDNVRGSRAFERADKALACLRRHGMVFGVSLTATKQNYREIVSDDFVTYLNDAGCFFTWIFDLKPIGRAATEETRRLVLSQAEKDYVNSAVTRINKIASFVYINTEKDPLVIGGCPAHKGTYMHVSCDGYVTPCIAMRYFDKNVTISTMSFNEVVQSEFLQNFRAIGNGEGCPTRFYPVETRRWIDSHGLEYLYGDAVSASVDRDFLADRVSTAGRTLLPVISGNGSQADAFECGQPASHEQ